MSSEKCQARVGSDSDAQKIQFLENSRAHIRVHRDALISNESADRHFRGITKPLYDMGQGAILFRVTHHWNKARSGRNALRRLLS
jgi:hypothetical protein